MTVRLILSAIVLAALLASPAAAQRFRIPDSLAYLGMADDPLEYVREVVGGASLDLSTMNRVGGCVSDGGWTKVAIEEMYRIAETDTRMRANLEWDFGLALRTAVTRPEDVTCPDDLPDYDRWMRNALRRDWETGVVSVRNNRGSTTLGLIRALRYSRSPETHELIRNIAFDPDVRPTIREQAARAMGAHRVAEMRARPNMTPDESLDVYLDMLEAMLREHGDDLVPTWVKATRRYLQYNGRMLDWRLPWLPPPVVDTIAGGRGGGGQRSGDSNQ